MTLRKQAGEMQSRAHKPSISPQAKAMRCEQCVVHRLGALLNAEGYPAAIG